MIKPIITTMLFIFSFNVNANPTLTSPWFGHNMKQGEVVIVKSERIIYYFLDDKGNAVEYPVAVGKSKTPSPSGEHFIERKAVNPTWYPPESIRLEDPLLPLIVPPGPKNPLGVRAMYLSGGLLRIHGTNKESSVGKAVSHGCFRMHRDDLIDLYDRVTIGTKVFIFK